MPKSTRDLEEQIRLARTIAWQNQLDQFTDSSLQFLQKSIGQAQLETATRLEHWAGHPTPTGWSEDRSHALLNELGAMSVATQNLITGHIGETASHAGSASLGMHNDIVSWGGRAVPFNAVSLTLDQIRELVYGQPVGGRLLQDWVHRTFDANLIEGIRQEMLTGLLQGESYPKLIDRIAEGWGMTRIQATTLTRTYVQSANTGAMMAIYNRNKDIIKGWKWVATMEVGGPHGGGTCLRCAVLDGHVYLWTDPEAPEIPLHPNCRCVPMPITLTWRELGLDINEMEDVYRPWTYSDLNIREGRGGKVIPMGFHQGDFGSLYPTLPDDTQKNIVGPGRWQLIKDGIVKFADLVDPTTGQLRLLEKVGGKIIGLAGFGAQTGVELPFVPLGPAPIAPEIPPAAPGEAILPPPVETPQPANEKAVMDAFANPDMVSREPISSGINSSEKVVLNATDPYSGKELKGVFKAVANEDRFAGRISMTNEDFTLAEREALSFQVAKQLGMEDIFPETVYTHIAGEPGSIQRWVEKTATAHSKWGGASDYHFNEWDGIRGTLFDVLIGNTDRHLENILVEKTGAKRIVLIDHGYTFINHSRDLPLDFLEQLRIGFLREEMMYKTPGKPEVIIGEHYPFGRNIPQEKVDAFVAKLKNADITELVRGSRMSQSEIDGFTQRKEWLIDRLEHDGLERTLKELAERVETW